MPSAEDEIRPPSRDRLRQIGALYGMSLTNGDVDFFANLAERTLESYRRVASLPEPKPEVRHARDGGYRPSAEQNPLNAWYWRCSIKGEREGKLSGKTVALKDNICLAGIPMMSGSSVLEGFVPDVDATIVQRVLDAGGEVVGKAVCENFCLSGTSNTADTGFVLNPRSPAHSAGGSSSGSAALVAAGACDLSIGGDQGGSVRIPSALCGVYGLKPTYGLVPYTGILPLENTLDHAGPIGRSVHDVALLLEVIAGSDPLDPRQRDAIQPTEYTETLAGGVVDLRLGVLQEGFGWPEASDDVDTAVREAAFKFEKAGATVREISVPLHRDGIHIYNPIFSEGGLAGMVRGNGFGTGWKGYYPTAMIEFLGKARKRKADEFPDSVKLLILMGEYMLDEYHGRFYARAQNQVRLLEDAYEAAFRDVDLLVMPTCAPFGTALPLIADASREEMFASGVGHHVNSCPFNLTGHPAISVPCAEVLGLPVGMMLVGRRWEDATVLRAAHAFEEDHG